MTTNKAYSDSATANPVVRISLLKCTSAQALNRAFFYGSSFLVDCVGASDDAPILVLGKANPAQSATLLISLNGGSSQTLYEDFTMPNHTQVTPEFDVITYAIIQTITLDGQTCQMPLVYDLPTLPHAKEALALTDDSSAFIAKYTEHYYHDQAAYQRRLNQLGRVH